MKVREVGILKKDPDAIKAQIDKLDQMREFHSLPGSRKQRQRDSERAEMIREKGGHICYIL